MTESSYVSRLFLPAARTVASGAEPEGPVTLARGSNRPLDILRLGLRSSQRHPLHSAEPVRTQKTSERDHRGSSLWRGPPCPPPDTPRERRPPERPAAWKPEQSLPTRPESPQGSVTSASASWFQAPATSKHVLGRARPGTIRGTELTAPGARGVLRASSWVTSALAPWSPHLENTLWDPRTL